MIHKVRIMSSFFFLLSLCLLLHRKLAVLPVWWPRNTTAVSYFQRQCFKKNCKQTAIEFTPSLAFLFTSSWFFLRFVFRNLVILTIPLKCSVVKKRAFFGQVNSMRHWTKRIILDTYIFSTFQSHFLVRIQFYACYGLLKSLTGTCESQAHII